MLRTLPALLTLLALGAAADQSGRGPSPAPDGWTQWGGPARNFDVPAGDLADTWPESGPPVLWSRPLGTGHSAIVASNGRLFTLYRTGNARAKLGPWNDAETVVALDARTGRTLWEHRYPARTGLEDFSFGPGPHSTPLVVGDRVFTIGTNLQLFAFDAATGRVLWSHDLVRDFGAPELLLRPNVKAGYACSPIAWRDTILCSVGGPGQSVMAFRQADGVVAWKNGDFLTSGAAPILIDVGGRTHAVFFGGGAITGLDPTTGEILWSHPHDPGNDLNCSTPLFDPRDNTLFVSSAYQAGSRAIQLTSAGAVTHAHERWFTNRVRFMFLGAVRIGDVVYGTSGDFGPAFLTALDLRTGEAAWQVRGFARSSLLHADGRLLAMTEDGDLAMVRVSPTGAETMARVSLFETTTWTAPTLVGTTLYARDREKIVALDLGRPATTDEDGSATAATRPIATATSRPEATTASMPASRSSVSSAAGPITAADAARPAPQAPPVAPSIDGAWTLDAPASTVAPGASLVGLAAAGAPRWLFVTQPANGTMLAESATNTSRARFYRPGEPTTTAIADGTITMTTTVSADAIVAVGRTTAANGTVTTVRERFSRDGDALIVEVTAGEQSSRLRYVPLRELGPCASWPSPCKKAADR